MISKIEKVWIMFMCGVVLSFLIALLALFAELIILDKWHLTREEKEFLLVSDYEYFLNDECISVNELSRTDVEDLFEKYEIEVYDGLKEVRFYSNKAVDFIEKKFLDDLTLYYIIISVFTFFGAVWVFIDDEEW